MGSVIFYTTSHSNDACKTKRDAVLKIKMYPAGNGDAFLISSAGTNLLIDAGYAQTFDDYISHDLLDLSHRGERLDLIIATHIDADHISGLIRFLALNGSSDLPQLIAIGDIWHNSLRSLSVRNRAEISTPNREVLKAICQRGHRHRKKSFGTVTDEISARQGSSLASLIYNGGYKWNLGNGTTSITMDRINLFLLPGGTVRVIGPTQERLDQLLKWWKRRMREMGYTGPTSQDEVIDDAFDLMCEHESETTTSAPVPLSSGGRKLLNEIYEMDSSITNSSSIATIVELGGIRVLMLADAWAEDMVYTLRKLQSQGCSMMFDAIKISHHGSLHNTSPELLELIDAPIYMVSSNGAGHSHPDFEVLAAIVDRAAGFTRTLYLNYATPASNLLREHQSKSNTLFTVHENVTDWISIGRT